MDIVTPEQRSKNMAAIRSKDTKPEVYFRKLLFAKGYRYSLNSKTVPGHPDIYLRKYNIKYKCSIQLYSKNNKKVKASRNHKSL